MRLMRPLRSDRFELASGLRSELRLITLACLAVASSYSAFAEIPLDPICKTVQNLPYPPADLPSAEEAKKLTTCDSSDLFFGFHAAIDHAQARKCAYLEMDGKVRSENDIEQNFGRGYRLLAFIYGNGIGVKQNYSLAEKFACHPEYEHTNDPDFTQADFDYIRTQVGNELQQLEGGRASGAKQPLGLCSSFHQEGKDDWCQPFEVTAERSLAIHRAIEHIESTDSKRRSELNLLLSAETTFSKAEQLEIAQDGDSPAIWDWNAARTLDLEFLLDSGLAF